MSAHFLDCLTLDRYLAGDFRLEARERPHQRGFPGTVAAEDADDFASVDSNVDIPQHARLAVPSRNAVSD